MTTTAAAPRVRLSGSRPSAVLALAGVVVALVLGHPALLLLSLVGSATAVCRRWCPPAAAVPVAAAGLLVAAVALGLAAAAAEVALHPPAPVLLLLAGGAVLLAPAGDTAVPRRRPDLLLALPAAVAVVVGLLQGSSADLAASWAFLGTDLAQHLLALRDVQQAGALSYAAEAYPRGLHALAALLSVGAPTDAAALLAYDLRLWSSLCWLTLALAIHTGRVLLGVLAEGLGWPASRLRLAALLWSGGTLLFNPVADLFVLMGAAPSLLAVVVLWLPVLHAARRPRPAHLLLTVAVTTVLVAHLWQALVPVPAMTLLALDPRAWTGRWSSRDVPAVLGGLVVGLAAVPPLLAVVDAGGTGLAAIPGELPSAPLPVLVLGVVAVVVGARGGAAAGSRALGASALGLLVVCGVLLRGADRGLDLSQYYPQKVLWFAAVLVGPVAVMGATAGSARLWALASVALGRLGAAARVARVGVLAALAALAVAYVLPPAVAVPHTGLATVAGLWSSTPTVSDDRYRTGVRLAADGRGRVLVPVAVGDSALLDGHGSYVVSKVLSFTTRQPQNQGRLTGLCRQVREVAGGARAAVVSRVEPALVAQLLAREGCPEVPVLRVPGEIRDTDALVSMLGLAAV